MIAYLYNLSKRQVAAYVNDNLSAKYFVGLAVDQKAPDHSTLTKFRKRMLERGKLQVFEEMLADVVRVALESGVQFGSLQIVDSVHSIANVRSWQDSSSYFRISFFLNKQITRSPTSLVSSTKTSTSPSA